MELLNKQKRLWAEIDLDAIDHNFDILPKPICCVVKANAYGHGAVQLAKEYEKLKADYLAVSNIEEAIQIRNAGIKTPILILGYTPPHCVHDLEKFNITQCLYSFEYANVLSKECSAQNKFIKCHLKIDTGMGRIGFQYHDGVNELEDAYKSSILPGIRIEGIFMHFAIADEGQNKFTFMQKKYFVEAIEELESRGIVFQIKHCSNSAATLDYQDFKMDMVRAGIILYGINPTSNKKNDLKPALSLWSVVSNVKKIRKGDSVSYGRTFIADRDMTIATVPVGYADGFLRSNSGSNVFINGKTCPIVGRVCMDQIMVACEDAKLDDLVEVYGPHISVDYVAKYNNTIPYEILCAIGERVPRVYKRDGKIVEIQDKLL